MKLKQFLLRVNYMPPCTTVINTLVFSLMFSYHVTKF